MKDQWQHRSKFDAFTSARVNGFFGVLLGMSENSVIGRIGAACLKFPVTLLTTCQDSNYSDSELSKITETLKKKRYTTVVTIKIYIRA